MKKYPSLPSELVEGWTSGVQVHSAGTAVDLHYHDSEEWLELARGQMTFHSLSGQAWPLEEGDVFHIPRGEVHRVDIGERGVEYRMYTHTPPAGVFTSNALSPDEVELLRSNLEFPLREENADGRAAEFFAAQLSDALAFGRADASVVGKDAFTGGFVARGRASSGTIRVLNRKDNGLLLSTVVTVGSGSEQKAFTNLRLFVREGDAWKCRIWLNHPEPR